MEHLAQVQVEFLKEARKWDKMSLGEQKAYLKRHPKSKRKITAKPDRSQKLKFKKGQHVRLKPNESEGWPEEFGKIEAIDTTKSTPLEDALITVRIDKKYRDEGDDGLREVTADQLEAK